MEEKRKHKRYPIAYPLEKADNSTEMSFDLKDISSGGVAFTSSSEIKPSDTVKLRLFLKNKMFQVKAIVVHASRIKDGLYAVGVKFINLTKDFHQTLEREIEEITQIHRENNLYSNNNISYKDASARYLKKLSSPSK